MKKKLPIFMMFGLIISLLGSGISYINLRKTAFANESFPKGVKAQEETAQARIKRFKKGDKFVIALIPERNVFEQRRRYKHITAYLSQKLNLDVRAEILSSYGEICDAFLEGKADAGFFGSFSYVLTRAKAGIEPIARPVWPNGSSTYSGYIFVRKDSGIKTVEDMKGMSLVLVHKATTAGYIFQLAYFKKFGINNIEKYFSKIYFAGSHDTSAWAVYTGEADVGGGKNHIFNALSRENPDFKEQMLILATSPEVPSNGLAVSKYLDPVFTNRLEDLLLNLDKTGEGRLVLERFGAVKFIETEDEDYSSLHQMIEGLGIDLDTYPYKD
ncbi:phosphate-import protein PhnD precursor [bacterium BMS3Abin06]|nr:phosphate-import protein PhnD precursor [bacterium BMS3Abin06]